MFTFVNFKLNISTFRRILCRFGAILPILSKNTPKVDNVHSAYTIYL